MSSRGITQRERPVAGEFSSIRSAVPQEVVGEENEMDGQNGRCRRCGQLSHLERRRPRPLNDRASSKRVQHCFWHRTRHGEATNEPAFNSLPPRRPSSSPHRTPCSALVCLLAPQINNYKLNEDQKWQLRDSERTGRGPALRKRKSKHSSHVDPKSSVGWTE